MQTEAIVEIHESMINGQRKQAVRQIDEYGVYDFFADYKEFLEDAFSKEHAYKCFADVTISYHRIKNR